MAVLEEPEHLTWFHHGQRWTDAFRHVVGVIHTNYVDYIRRGGGRAASLSVTYLNRRVCCIHCHKVGDSRCVFHGQFLCSSPMRSRGRSPADESRYLSVVVCCPEACPMASASDYAWSIHSSKGACGPAFIALCMLSHAPAYSSESL